jgi:hypothetical protein
MRKATMRAALSLCLLSLLLAACSDGGGSIYATIETEQKVSTNSLADLLLTVNDVVKAAAGEYYVAAGGIFRGVVQSGGTITWSPDQNSADTDRPYNVAAGDLCNALAFFGGTLYGGFLNQAGSLGLYTAAAVSGIEGVSFQGQARVEDAAVKDQQVVSLRTVNGRLFMVGAVMPSGGTAYAYSINVLDGTSSPWQSLVSGLTDAVVSIGWDGVNYWMATTAAVYSDAGTTPAFASGTSTLGGSTVSGIKDIFTDAANGRVLICTKSGGIYYSLDRGGTWNHIAAPSPSGTTAVASFLCAAGPVDTAADKYLLGTDGYGYYTLSLTGTGSGATLTRYGSTSVALYGQSVRTMLVDGSSVFMGTNTHGLWRATFDPATGGLVSGTTWSHE